MKPTAIEPGKRTVKLLVACVALTVTGSLAAQTDSSQTAHAQSTQNVIVVMMDGLRWQEVFDRTSGPWPGIGTSLDRPRVGRSWVGRNLDGLSGAGYVGAR